MAINIQIQKKDLWLFVALVVFLAGSVYVIAYNSGGPPNLMGHSSEELEIDINGDGVLDKTLQQAVDEGDFGSGSETCPEGTTKISGWCMEDALQASANLRDATSNCHSKDMQVCPWIVYVTCDFMDLAVCSETDEVNRQLWVSDTPGGGLSWNLAATFYSNPDLTHYFSPSAVQWSFSTQYHCCKPL